MSWIDVAILAVVVLIGLIGVLRGVKKSALTLGAFLISFLLAFFLANVIAEALLGIDGVKDFVLGNGVDGKAHWSLAKWIYDGTAGKLPDSKSFLYKNFYAPMLEVVKSSNATIPVEAGFALYGAFLMFSAICGVGIFFVARFLLMIVTAIIKTYIGKKKSVLGRLFGFVLGAVRGALWMFAFTVVFSCFGGYTFVSGIKGIQNEYENNAVVCGYFNQGAYALRNKLLLPDKDAYGRLVEMVYKKEAVEDPNAEKLTGDRLKLYVNISNLNYDNSPYGIDENKKRTFDAANAKARVATEFSETGFDTVAKDILDYNTHIASLLDDTTKLTSLGKKFGTYNTLVAPSDSIVTIDGLMNKLWAQMRTYELHYTEPDREKELTVLNSMLSADYNAISLTLTELKNKFLPFIDDFGDHAGFALPELRQLEAE